MRYPILEALPHAVNRLGPMGFSARTLERRKLPPMEWLSGGPDGSRLSKWRAIAVT